MVKFDKDSLSAMLQKDLPPRLVEDSIFSVFPTNEHGNEYDGQFGFFYDLIACNPIYNRLIWGYSIHVFRNMAKEALNSSCDGCVLDLASGSLAFTAKAYAQYIDRPVILMDQSLKMLKMAKARLIKEKGRVPENIIFLHSDALHLPFKKNTFNTVISENLLHCLQDTAPLLNQLQNVLTQNGTAYFSTLVKRHRWADKYLQGLADSGKIVSRTVNDHRKKFDQLDFATTYETLCNLLLIQCKK
ncbi:MAG: class I SAM-dependent methyltransferase [Desulfobacterales bacterium]|nr:class I SAM-dependent methyltransferase [Desulfobacterales bacterium]